MLYLNSLIKIANDLDKAGLTKEADYLDSLLVKSAFNWRDWTPDFIETSVDYWSDNSIADAYEDVVEEGYDYLFNKLNEWAREEYSWVISRGGSGILRFIAGSIPTPLGSHTFGGGNKALTWTADGIQICGFSFEKMINKLADANESALGFSGGDVLRPLYNSLEGLIKQYPVILYAVDYIQGYGEYAKFIEEKTGLWNFNYESLLWGYLTSPLHDIVLPNGVPFIAEVGEYCDLVNSPNDMDLIDSAVKRIAAQTGQSENLEKARAILEPRIREWQSILLA